MIAASKVGLTDKFRPPATKVCRLCEKEKPIKEFSLNIKGRNGYSNECRGCKKEHEDQKQLQRKERAKTFFDAKFFMLLLLSTSLTAFSQVSQHAVCYHNSPACRCSNGKITDKAPTSDTTKDLWLIDGKYVWKVKEVTPDTLRAICLVTLFPNGVAHSRMGFVVIEQGKRPVYLDCRKRALKLPQVGWDFREAGGTNK
ncbi:MAG TPA: hypothetical protein VF008_09895 [Niastella sp.]